MAQQHGAAPLVIANLAELGAFAGTREFTSARPLVLTVPEMPVAEAFVLSERLNRDRAECGCSLGAKAMTAGFGLTLGALMIVYGPLTLAFLERSPISLAAAFVFAAVGKVAGIALGRRRARHGVSRILETFNRES
jgi:hypothetical protein